MPTLLSLGLVEAAVEVIPQSSALLRMADPMRSLAEALTSGGGPWRLVYAEISDCGPLLADILSSPAGVSRSSGSARRGRVVVASVRGLLASGAFEIHRPS